MVITLVKENTDIPDSTEVVSICAGENYLGWTESGVYERKVIVNNTVQNQSVNLISNGDFSNGTTGWNTWGASGYSMTMTANSKDYISAPGSLQISCGSNGTSVSSLQFISLADMSVIAGKEYELSFYAKATTAVELRKFVIIQRKSPYAHYGAFENIIPVVSQDWKQIKVKFTASQTANDASLRIYLGNTLPAGQSLYFDDIAFSEYSEAPVAKDQVIKTHLTVNQPRVATEDIKINEGEAYMGWTTSGEYTRTVESSVGCDSVITTNLTVVTGPEYVTICEGEEYNGWFESGVYEWTSPSENGTGVLRTTYLIVEETKYVTETINIWVGEDYNGWKEPGHYERVLKSASGCDSVVITKLMVRGKTQIYDNETMEQNLPTNTDVTQEGETMKEFLLYPNPAETFINVEYRNFPDSNTRIEILDGSGRTVLSQEVVSAKNRIDFYQLNPGMYYLRSINEQSQQVEKFIIK